MTIDWMHHDRNKFLETKWGLIEHNVSRFCGIYSQILRLNKSWTNAADALKTTRVVTELLTIVSL